MSVFDVINNLSGSKEYIYTPELEVVPYVINTAMSQHYDCIMIANELNVRPQLPKRLVYDYYHFAIQPKKKRFAKWASTKANTDVVLVADYYKCSFQIAEQYLKILTSDQLKVIKEKMDTGGKR